MRRDSETSQSMIESAATLYATLPPRGSDLEGAALSMVQGRMQATKDHLLETFQRFEGSVIYPCAHTDLMSAVDLQRLFPNAKIVLNDLIDPNHISNLLTVGERPRGTDAIIGYLRQRFLFDRTSEWNRRDEIRDLTFEVTSHDEHHPILRVSFKVDTSSYNPQCVPEHLAGVSSVSFEYRVTDLFSDDSMPSGIVFLRRPGWQGSLMKAPKLWERVRELVGDNTYVLVAADQGYRESAALIAQSFEPLLIDPYIDQLRPVLPLLSIGGSISTQVFTTKP